MNILSALQHLTDDPLGEIVIQTWQFPGGKLRWNGGMVQVRGDGDQYYTFPIPAQEFLAAQGSDEESK